jgi:hypothetical protein
VNNIKRFFFIIAVLVACTSYAKAHENKYIFVGQNGNEMAFTLEVIGNIPEDYIQINQEGQVHIQVDRIIAVPKEIFSQFSDYSASTNSVDQFLAFSTNKKELEDNLAECGSRREPRENKWQCPYCHHWWEPGERCQYAKCPTNLWEQEKEKEKKKDKG